MSIGPLCECSSVHFTLLCLYRRCILSTHSDILPSSPPLTASNDVKRLFICSTQRALVFQPNFTPSSGSHVGSPYASNASHRQPYSTVPRVFIEFLLRVLGPLFMPSIYVLHRYDFLQYVAMLDDYFYLLLAREAVASCPWKTKERNSQVSKSLYTDIL
ncbi:hypothetical protein BYT27DRAFT_6375809 [Phlegmacium glaucopus]|nr:hypothetical protein BYT27DRAFT_6375809 [Phlegmacium glaucopus]